MQMGLAAKARSQIAVQLDDGQPPQALKQRLGERGQAGADFHHGLSRAGGDSADDGVNHGFVAQKMLAEAFTGNVFHGVAPLPQGALKKAGHHRCHENRRFLPCFFFVAACRGMGAWRS